MRQPWLGFRRSGRGTGWGSEASSCGTKVNRADKMKEWDGIAEGPVDP